MNLPNVNRRVFMQASAAATASVSATTASAAVGQPDPAEVSNWKSIEGQTVRVGDAALKLESVTVTDYSADVARPKNIRPYSLSLLFRHEAGKVEQADTVIARHSKGTDRVSLTQIIPPEGKTGAFYESVIN